MAGATAEWVGSIVVDVVGGGDVVEIGVVGGVVVGAPAGGVVVVDAMVVVVAIVGDVVVFGAADVVGGARVVGAGVVEVVVAEVVVVVEQIDHDFTIVEVSAPDDPILPKICASRRQLRLAQAAVAEGRWNIIVALDPAGEPAGRIWETYATERHIANGVPRMRLAEDEFLMFDLFVERKYRRTGIAHTMADHFFRKYDPADPDNRRVRYGYGFVAYENIPSILWHHSIGFRIAQTMNYIAIGPYIKWKVPFSDVPRWGPMSTAGRHSDPGRDLAGGPLFPT